MIHADRSYFLSSARRLPEWHRSVFCACCEQVGSACHCARKFGQAEDPDCSFRSHSQCIRSGHAFACQGEQVTPADRQELCRRLCGYKRLRGHGVHLLFAIGHLASHFSFEKPLMARETAFPSALVNFKSNGSQTVSSSGRRSRTFVDQVGLRVPGKSSGNCLSELLSAEGARSAEAKFRQLGESFSSTDLFHQKHFGWPGGSVTRKLAPIRTPYVHGLVPGFTLHWRPESRSVHRCDARLP